MEKEREEMYYDFIDRMALPSGAIPVSKEEQEWYDKVYIKPTEEEIAAILKAAV